MKSAQLKQRLHEYINFADEKKLKAIYTIVEDEIENYDYTNDKKFINELNKRAKDLESGKEKGLSWNEVKAKAVKAIHPLK